MMMLSSMHALHGLSDKFAHVAGIIAHRDPFPDLETMRSMVITEDMRLKAKSQSSISNTSSSAPTILLVDSSNSRGQDARISRDNGTPQSPFEPQVCRNYARGFCKFGDTCKFLHDSTRSNNASRDKTIRNGNMSHEQLLALLQQQQQLLAQFGLSQELGQA
ncbi:hybrid signal transduction histidine kinase M [Tanacetum coccineum]